jgi:hypothetical protein
MIGIITEKHVAIDYVTGTKTFIVVAGNGEDWIVVPKRIWRRAFIQGWRKPFEDCQIEYGPNVAIKLKTVRTYVTQQGN